MRFSSEWPKPFRNSSIVLLRCFLALEVQDSLQWTSTFINLKLVSTLEAILNFLPNENVSVVGKCVKNCKYFIGLTGVKI